MDQPAAKKKSSSWIWILGLVWLGCSLAGVVLLVRSFIAKTTAAQKELSNPDAIGDEQRAFFVTPDELIAAGIWTSLGHDPGAPKIKRIEVGAEPYYLCTYEREGKNSAVVQTAGVVHGPAWVMKTMFRRAIKSAEEKKGYLEQEVQETAKHDYAAWRYCKEERCSQFLAMMSGEAKFVTVSAYGDVHPDPDKLGLALEASLARIDSYKKAHDIR